MQYRLLFYFLLVGCLAGCHTSIQYPPGGYDYLKDVSESDSDYYFLPIRKQIPLVDSMLYANEKYFFKAFHEPNSSIEPAGEDIFRLSIEGFSILATVITVTEKQLLIKQTKKNNQGSIYPEENYELLTDTEKQHYFFLEKFFPFGKRTYTHGRQLYIDSMIESEPKLLDVNYYRYLINKAMDKNVPAFEYSTKAIPLTTAQFKKLAETINASGYWKLPYSPELSGEAGTDGWGFWLEANTKHKYNIVSCNGIVKTKGTAQFKQACQQILDFAGIADFKIWDENREK